MVIFEKTRCLYDDVVVSSPVLKEVLRNGMVQYVWKERTANQTILIPQFWL